MIGVKTMDKFIPVEKLKKWDGAIWLMCNHWKGWAFPTWSETDCGFYFQCKNHENIFRSFDDYNKPESRWSFICLENRNVNLDD